MTERDYNDAVKMYADNVYRFVLKNLRSADDAKDAVQNSFEKLWMNRAEIPAEAARSWLFRAAYNSMIDGIRKTKRISLQEEFADTALGSTETPQHTKRILNEALNRLSETQRSLVMLKDYEGYSYAEIGEITGYTENQVKVYLHRARLQLREYIVKKENII